MLHRTTLGLLLTLLVACGEQPQTKPPAPAPAPKPTSVVLEVEARLPGRSALQLEAEAALPLEQAFSAVRGIEQTTTRCEKERCVVRLTFVSGVDVTEARDRVQARLLGLDALSKDAKVFLRPHRTMAPRVVLVLEPAGPDPALPATLRPAAETIVAPRLKQQRGVLGVAIRGGLRARCLVSADANRLAAFDVTPLELAEALGNKPLRPGGVGPPTMDALRDTVVTTRGDQPVLLKDVAEVRAELTNADAAGETSVSILVAMQPGLMQPGTSGVTLGTAIAKREFGLPAGMRLRTAGTLRPALRVWVAEQEEQPLGPRIQQVRALVLDVPGVESATIHRTVSEPEVVVALRPGLPTELGVTNAQLSATLQLGLEGRAVGIVLLGKEPVAVVLRVARSVRHDLDGLESLRIRASSGGVLTLPSVASVRQVRVPRSVFRWGSRRAAFVRIQTTKGANTEEVVEAVRRAVANRHEEAYVEAYEAPYEEAGRR